VALARSSTRNGRFAESCKIKVQGGGKEKLAIGLYRMRRQEVML